MFRASVEISLFSSYLKTAIRNLARHRIYSAINIIGIAIGLAFCIITFLFVYHEWTYDTFHENADRIYRVYVDRQNLWISSRISSLTPEPLGPALTEAFPNMQTIRFVNGGGKIGTENRAFWAKLGYVDPNFLDIFSFSVIHGDPTQALQDKYSTVITEKIAQKYFNKANPVGELLPIQRGKEIQNYTITGIVQNVPKNSTLQFDILLPFEGRSWLSGSIRGPKINPWNIKLRGYVYDCSLKMYPQIVLNNNFPGGPKSGGAKTERYKSNSSLSPKCISIKTYRNTAVVIQSIHTSYRVLHYSSCLSLVSTSQL